jgi:hypothetical protein
METDEFKHNILDLVERQRRLRTLMTILPAFIGILLWFVTSGLDERYIEYGLGMRRDVILLIIVSFFALSGVSLIVVYLQTGFKQGTLGNLEVIQGNYQAEADQEHEGKKAIERFKKYQTELDSLRKEISETRAAMGNLNESSRNDLLLDLRASLTRDAATEVIAEIRSQVMANEKTYAKDSELAARLDQSRLRLQRELEALGRRGNLNLALGAITTVVGISLLGFSVFAETSTAKDLWTLASHFAPRLALVLLIELFAFFFLSLYKSSLSEIKYFQNELTNIESRQLALSAAIELKESTLLADVVSKLASTERNHILSKDQTTIELEKARIDRDSQSNVIKAVAEFFQKKPDA